MLLEIKLIVYRKKCSEATERIMSLSNDKKNIDSITMPNTQVSGLECCERVGRFLNF